MTGAPVVSPAAQPAPPDGWGGLRRPGTYDRYLLLRSAAARVGCSRPIQVGYGHVRDAVTSMAPALAEDALALLDVYLRSAYPLDGPDWLGGSSTVHRREVAIWLRQAASWRPAQTQRIEAR